MRNDEALSADLLETVSGGDGKTTMPLGGAVHENVLTNWAVGGKVEYIAHQINNFVSSAHRSMVEFSKTPEFKAMQRAAQRTVRK